MLAGLPERTPGGLEVRRPRVILLDSVRTDTRVLWEVVKRLSSLFPHGAQYNWLPNSVGLPAETESSASASANSPLPGRMPYTPPCSSPPQNPLAAGAVRPLPSVLGHGRHHSEPAIGLSTRNPKLHLSSSYLRRHRRSPTLSRCNSSENGGRHENVKQNGHTFVNSGFWQIPHSGNTSTHTSTVPSPPDSRNNSSDEGENSGKMAGNSMDLFHKRSRTRTNQDRNVNTLSSRLGLLNLGPDTHGRGSRRLSKGSDALLLSGSSDIAVQTPDQSDQEDEPRAKPPMIRKKSGELVRPALRCSTKKKSKSLPGTPTYSKAVHFGAQLEEVRHFLRLDRPLAVSANSSPAESYESDNEFPFGLSDPPGRNKNFSWEARIANFPPNLAARRSMPVRLDRIFLSSDNKYLVGVVVVANLAFHKHVVARFTLDYWKTVSEVTAEYNNDIQLKEQAKEGYDTFNFNIGLADHSNLDEKRMFICIRYNVDGLEFWDNNNSMNYHIDFTKKHKLTNEKADSSPKSTFTSSVSADFVAGRPAKLTTRADDIVPESPTRRPTNAFGNRYNFETSLTAPAPAFKRHDSIFSNGKPSREVKDELDGTSTQISIDSQAGSLPEIPRSDLISDKLHHQSPVYKELVDKYCFFGSDKQGAHTQKRSDVARGSSEAVENKVPTSNIPETYSPQTSDSSAPSDSSPTDEKAPRSTTFSLRTRSPSRVETDSPRSTSHSYESSSRAFLSESPTPTAILG